MWTWSQLGLQRKPCGLLNVAGYYDHLLAFLDHVAEERFLSPDHRSMVLIDDVPGGCSTGCGPIRHPSPRSGSTGRKGS